LPRRRILFLSAILLLLVVLSLGFRWDLRRRIDDLEALMVSHAEVVSDIIAEANLHGLRTYQEWQNEFAARLLDDARWLAWMSASEKHDPERLAFLARGLDLQRILILDRNGGTVATYPSPEANEGFPVTFLKDLCEGTAQQTVLGIGGRTAGAGASFVVGVHRDEGGAVVVDGKADDLVAVRREIGPGHLLKSIGEERSVRYVIIQDETGIQASTLADISLPVPAEDPFLAPLAGGEPWVAREYRSAAGPVFEVAQVVGLYGGDAVLRVGLDAEPLVVMRADIRRRTVMRAGVLAASLVLLGALLLAWQRQGVLDHEVARVRAELEARQEETRRLGHLAAMGSLASGVAHQIRNPLNSIHMIAQRLGRMPELDEDVRTHAGHIRVESSRIEGIVQDFLDFARPRQPVLEKTDLAALVRDTVAIQAAAHAPKGAVITAYAPGMTAVVDPGFVREILENLIRNAVEAAGAEAKVLVSLIGDAGNAEIVVEDNGPGVSEEDRGRIFDLYYTTRPEGTGLGLSLVARMVADMGGTLELSGSPGLDGRGARFVVRLPRQADDTGRKERDHVGPTPDSGS